MRKRFLACVLAVVMMTCLAGAVSMAAGESNTLRIVWWGSQTRHDLTMAMLDKFMEKYPNIKVEPEFTDWNGYWSKLATQVAGGLTPDIIQMDYGYLMQYANNGILADLTPYIDSGVLDVSDVDESVIDSGKVGDGVYALSTGMNAWMLMYRQDVLDEAGVTLPFAPTQSQYIEATKTVYEKTGKTDTFVVGFGLDRLRFMLRNVGLNLYNDDGTALGFDDPSFMVNGWQTILDAQDAGYGLPIGEQTNASDFDIFINDTWIGGIWTNQLAAFEQASNVSLTLAEIPWNDSATQPATYFKPSMFWSVAESSAVKDAAVTFINFFTNDPDCYDIVATERAMPISSKIREYLEPKLDTYGKKVSDALNRLTELGDTTPIMKPDVSASGEIDALLAQYNEQVRYNLVNDLNAFALQFIDEANAIIAKSAN